MKTIVVAVGSTRHPKLNAVSDALAVFGKLLEPDATFEIAGVEVPSGVGHTPISRAELMEGARNRAEALRTIADTSNAPWDFFVGLEGGFDVVHRGAIRFS